MKRSTIGILAAGVIWTVAMTSAGWSPAEAQPRYREKPNRPVFAEHPGDRHGKKIRKSHIVRVRKAHRTRHGGYGNINFNVVRRGDRVVLRPVYARPFIVQRPRYVIVRPIPIWVQRSFRPTFRARFGNASGVSFSLAISDHAPLYGCNFCDRSFDDFRSWETHVVGCGHRGYPARVIVERWDDGDLDYFRAEALSAYRFANLDVCRYRG
jgi:hypothetical protein